MSPLELGLVLEPYKDNWQVKGGRGGRKQTPGGGGQVKWGDRQQGRRHRHVRDKT